MTQFNASVTLKHVSMDTVDSLSLDYNASLSYSYKQYRADTLSGTVISSQCICLPDALKSYEQSAPLKAINTNSQKPRVGHIPSSAAYKSINFRSDGIGAIHRMLGVRCGVVAENATMFSLSPNAMWRSCGVYRRMVWSLTGCCSNCPAM